MSRSIVLLLVLACALGASRRTANFVVDAPTQDIADRVAAAAEQQRKKQALAWLGKELPPWPEPCPLRVEVNLDHPCGATTFVFADKGGVKSQNMAVRGSLERILAGVLPHEVTHTIFAHFLGRPVPRWADEGGAVLTEDRQEHDRHADNLRQAFKCCKHQPLRRLFALHEFPPQRDNLLAFYGQSYSVSRFLIEAGDRTKFLAFVKRGYDEGWDEAAQQVYGFKNVEELDQAWLRWAQAP